MLDTFLSQSTFFNPFFSRFSPQPSTVPPDIVNEESSADISVQEGEDATLVCRATGHPTPRVTWRREDNDFILMRKAGGRELAKCKSFSATYYVFIGNLTSHDKLTFFLREPQRMRKVLQRWFRWCRMLHTENK